jgi:hypothetical protein
MTHPNHNEPDNPREPVLFIVFSLVTCIVMLAAALLLGTSV